MGVDLGALLEEDVVPVTATDSEEGIHTHIIDRGDSDMTAEALVLRARIYGFVLTALCGYKWVPSRDPMKYPVCPKCLEIFEFASDFRGV